MNKLHKLYHKEYKQDHKLAKFIVASIVSIIFIYENYDMLEVLAVWIWFFGTNFFQYIIESIRGHKHKVDKL